MPLKGTDAGVWLICVCGDLNEGVVMKRCAWLLVFLASCLTVSGELTRDQISRLEEVEIDGIDNDTEKIDDKKVELLEVTTLQNNDEEDFEGYRIRMVVELTDKKAKKSYLVDYKANRPSDLDTQYTGEDHWTLYMPHGDLERVKLTGYAIQYGFMDGEEFVVFGEEFDDVDSLDELLKRTTTPLPGTMRLKHYYMYEDEDEGETESDHSWLRAVR